MLETAPVNQYSNSVNLFSNIILLRPHREHCDQLQERTAQRLLQCDFFQLEGHLWEASIAEDRQQIRAAKHEDPPKQPPKSHGGHAESSEPEQGKNHLQFQVRGLGQEMGRLFNEIWVGVSFNKWRDWGVL